MTLEVVLVIKDGHVFTHRHQVVPLNTVTQQPGGWSYGIYKDDRKIIVRVFRDGTPVYSSTLSHFRKVILLPERAVFAGGAREQSAARLVASALTPLDQRQGRTIHAQVTHKPAIDGMRLRGRCGIAQVFTDGILERRMSRDGQNHTTCKGGTFLVRPTYGEDGLGGQIITFVMVTVQPKYNRQELVKCLTNLK